jgi:hypothetical protein
MGVSYDVLSLHNSVFRQIVPSELLVHMGLLDHHHLFNHNHKKSGEQKVSKMEEMS